MRQLLASPLDLHRPSQDGPCRLQPLGDLRQAAARPLPILLKALETFHDLPQALLRGVEPGDPFPR